LAQGTDWRFLNELKKELKGNQALLRREERFRRQGCIG
jgi:hypothetical protein